MLYIDNSLVPQIIRLMKEWQFQYANATPFL